MLLWDASYFYFPVKRIQKRFAEELAPAGGGQDLGLSDSESERYLDPLMSANDEIDGVNICTLFVCLVFPIRTLGKKKSSENFSIDQYVDEWTCLFQGY